jgi:cytosine/adenosine deaminase-related metal-dependent hydrolase
MIVRARAIVTMDRPAIENGAVRVHGDRIIQIGKFSEIASSGEETIDLGDHILLPGLINTHCHLDYTCLRGRIPTKKSFAEWIRAINAEKGNLTAKDYIASINAGFVEAQRFGTTTIANLTGTPELVAKIDEPILTWWFAELIDVRESGRAREIVDSANKSLNHKPNWGLAPHAPFTASRDVFNCCRETAGRENVLLTTHLAESGEEMEMFRDSSGPLYQLLKDIGRDMSDCGRTTPLEVFVRNLQVARRSPWAARVRGHWIIAHLNDVAESDFDLLRQMPQKFSIAHCPRSHAYFDHTAFQFKRLQALGFNICLGTDSLASNDDLSLFAEMRVFHAKFPDVECETILEMTTVNSARALRCESRLGKISEGFIANMTAVPITRSKNLHETILNFAAEVPWIMLHGEILPNH